MDAIVATQGNLFVNETKNVEAPSKPLDLSKAFDTADYIRLKNVELDEKLSVGLKVIYTKMAVQLKKLYFV